MNWMDRYLASYERALDSIQQPPTINPSTAIAPDRIIPVMPTSFLMYFAGALPIAGF